MSVNRSVQFPDEPALRRQWAQDPLASLIPPLLSGDVKAQRTLLTAVGPQVLSIVRRVFGAHHPDLEDLCQESLVALLSALPTFKGECTVLHFASRVALFTALSARRRNQYRIRENADFVADEEPENSTHPNPAELLEQREIRTALRELLDELPMHQSEVLASHVVLGHTVEEISQMTDASVNTIRSRLRRGLETLRELLDLRGDLRRQLRGAK